MAIKVTLFANILDLALNPIVNAEMTVAPSGLQKSETNALASRSISAFSNASGVVSILTAPSIPVEVHIPQYSFEKFLITPASGSLNVTC